LSYVTAVFNGMLLKFFPLHRLQPRGGFRGGGSFGGWSPPPSFLFWPGTGTSWAWTLYLFQKQTNFNL